MDMMELYLRAQDGFDKVLTGVGPDQWDQPSACAEWSVRDVAGHVIWGQRQLRAWATGEEYGEAGGPGTPHPGALAVGDPVALWRAARDAATPTLTAETLARPTAIPGIGEVPLAAIVALLTTDTVTHTWDIGHPLGADVTLDPAVVSAAFEWSRANIMRRPGFFGPELTPPAGADEQTRLLAFLGRE
jgi:uncharacterized protein (TIGR03086 family)